MLGHPANRTRGLIVAGDDGRSNLRGMGRTVSPRRLRPQRRRRAGRLGRPGHRPLVLLPHQRPRPATCSASTGAPPRWRASPPSAPPDAARRADHRQGRLRGAGRGRAGRPRDRPRRPRADEGRRRRHRPGDPGPVPREHPRRAPPLRDRRAASAAPRAATGWPAPPTRCRWPTSSAPSRGRWPTCTARRRRRRCTTGAAAELQRVWIATRVALREVLEATTLADIASGRPPRERSSTLAARPDGWARR